MHESFIQQFHLGYTTRNTPLEDLAWLDIYGNPMPDWFPWSPGQPDNPKVQECCYFGWPQDPLGLDGIDNGFCNPSWGHPTNLPFVCELPKPWIN